MTLHDRGSQLGHDGVERVGARLRAIAIHLLRFRYPFRIFARLDDDLAMHVAHLREGDAKALQDRLEGKVLPLKPRHLMLGDMIPRPSFDQGMLYRACHAHPFQGPIRGVDLSAVCVTLTLPLMLKTALSKRIHPSCRNFGPSREACHNQCMKAVVAILCSAILLGCSGPEGELSMPRAADVERLEAAVARHPCIGSLDGWERNYRFAMSKRVFWPDSNHANQDVIEFHLRRAGTVAIAPARNLVPLTENGDWPDSSPIRTVDGSFVISSGRLTVARCKPL